MQNLKIKTRTDKNNSVGSDNYFLRMVAKGTKNRRAQQLVKDILEFNKAKRTLDKLRDGKRHGYFGDEEGFESLFGPINETLENVYLSTKNRNTVAQVAEAIAAYADPDLTTAVAETITRIAIKGREPKEKLEVAAEVLKSKNVVSVIVGLKDVAPPDSASSGKQGMVEIFAKLAVAYGAKFCIDLAAYLNLRRIAEEVKHSMGNNLVNYPAIQARYDSLIGFIDKFATQNGANDWEKKIGFA